MVSRDWTVTLDGHVVDPDDYVIERPAPGAIRFRLLRPLPPGTTVDTLIRPGRRTIEVTTHATTLDYIADSIDRNGQS